MNTLRRLATAALVTSILATLAVPHVHAVTIDWVTVGNPGNQDNIDPNNRFGIMGGVGYIYQISKYETTIGQYTEFLNAVAKSDPYSLYVTGMGTDLNNAGIIRSGTSGNYQYTAATPAGVNPPGAQSATDRPIGYISWWNTARFANWMHNGQPVGDQGPSTTEAGAYTLNGQVSGTAPAKNAGASVYIPTLSEWYKAAYYSPALNGGSGGYFKYATQSDQVPGNVIGSGSNQANYLVYSGSYVYSVTQSTGQYINRNYLTDVGAFSASPSYYGTFDQSGNLLEWNDSSGWNGVSGQSSASTQKGIIGGDFGSTDFGVSFSGYTSTSAGSVADLGFRLASPVPVPEPSAYCMALAGLACGGYSMFRRRRRA